MFLLKFEHDTQASLENSLRCRPYAKGFEGGVYTQVLSYGDGLRCYIVCVYQEYNWNVSECVDASLEPINFRC